MAMDKFKKVVGISLLGSFLLVGCSSEEEVEPKIKDEPTEVEEVEEEEEEVKDESSVGKRSNPVPLGETVEFPVTANDDDGNSFDGVGSMVFNDVVRGEEAFNQLMEMNQFNEEAPEGYEWAIINTKFTLDELETEDESFYVWFTFNSYGADGSESPTEPYGTVDNEFGFVDLYSGGSNEGLEAILVPKGDDDVKVKVSDWGTEIFFEIQ